MKTSSNCIICDSSLSGKQTRFCSEACKNKFHQSYDSQKKRALERKMFLVKLLGAKCSVCSYNKNLSALSFHHKSGKEFKLDSRSLSNRKVDSTVSEIEKCILVCSNCHAELHNPKLNLAKLSIEPTALTTELQARFSKRLKTNSILPEKGLLDNEKKESNLPNKFASLIRKLGRNKTIILGVSGGVDSVVMLDLFSKLTGFKLIVAHLNHGVRAEADSDEQFVKELATHYGLKFISHKIERPKKGNLEEEMRLLRRNFLTSVGEKEQADFISLAHNANDQAETFFLNLLRGSGPAGLAGMKESGKIIRPLLTISRGEIEDYARENKLEWREDESNQDLSYNRNFLRHEVLPKLSKVNPSWLETLARTSEVQKNIDDYLKSQAIKHLTEKTTSLQKLPQPILFEVFGLLYEKVRGNRMDLTLEHLQSLEKLVTSTHGTKKIELPGKIIAIRQYDSLDFEAKNDYNQKSQLTETPLQIGKNQFGEWEIEILPAKDDKNSKETAVINAKDLTNLKVRVRKNGDRIKTFAGEKKLQDLFIDAKIRRENRDEWPVVVLDREIIWVPTLAVAKSLDSKNKSYKLTAHRRKN